MVKVRAYDCDLRMYKTMCHCIDNKSNFSTEITFLTKNTPF